MRPDIYSSTVFVINSRLRTPETHMDSAIDNLDAWKSMAHGASALVTDEAASGRGEKKGGKIESRGLSSSKAYKKV